MRITFISKYGSYYPYGLETRHLYISRELVKLGHKVDLYFSDSNHHLNRIPEKEEERVDGIYIHWIKTHKYQNPYRINRILSWIDFEFKLYRVLKMIQQDSPDVVIVSSLSLLSIINYQWDLFKKQIWFVVNLRS